MRVPLEAQRADAGPGAYRLQEQFRAAGVVQRLVDGPSGERAPFHMADQRGCQPGRQHLAHAYEELVAVAGVGRGTLGGGLVGADHEVEQAETRAHGQQLGGGDQ